MPNTKIDGININYRIVGEGPHTVLCLPGFLGTIDNDFGPFFEKADKSKFRFVCWDPPGYGGSHPPKRQFVPGYLQKDADLAWQLMEKLDIESYSILGWSQGGGTGILLAASNPESVVKLIIMGTESSLGPSSVRTYDSMKNIDFWPLVHLEKQLKYHGKNYLREMTMNMSDYCKQMIKYYGGDYLKKAPSRVKCPVLIVHGQDDLTCPVQSAQDFHTKFEKSELVILPTAKHDIHLSHMDEFMELFEKFLLSD